MLGLRRQPQVELPPAITDFQRFLADIKTVVKQGNPRTVQEVTVKKDPDLHNPDKNILNLLVWVRYKAVRIGRRKDRHPDVTEDAMPGINELIANIGRYPGVQQEFSTVEVRYQQVIDNENR